jgi:hypothetical protein
VYSSIVCLTPFFVAGVQTASLLKACTASKTTKGTGSHTGLTKMVKAVLEGSDKTRWAGLHEKAVKNMYYKGDKPTVAAFLKEMVVGHDDIEGIMKQYSTQKGAKKWGVLANQCAMYCKTEGLKLGLVFVEKGLKKVHTVDNALEKALHFTGEKADFRLKGPAVDRLREAILLKQVFANVLCLQMCLRVRCKCQQHICKYCKCIVRANVLAHTCQCACTYLPMRCNCRQNVACLRFVFHFSAVPVLLFSARQQETDIACRRGGAPNAARSTLGANSTTSGPEAQGK